MSSSTPWTSESTGDRDWEADERELAADDRDRVAADRERTADAREVAADRRERDADARDRVADRRDVAADARDRAADARDRVADQRSAGLDVLVGLRDARIRELVSEVDGLHSAIEHRSVIEQAKGVIMHALHCSPDAAFAVLVAQSQAENRKLRDIAAELAAAQDWK